MPAWLAIFVIVLIAITIISFAKVLIKNRDLAMKNRLKIALILLLTTIVAFAGNKKIVVDLSKQVAYAYEGKTLVYKGWISSGKKEHRTPVGVFRVLAKEKEHISNEWPKPNGGAKMPYMLRLTWSGIAMHLGYTPNSPASHGCIRLKDGFAQKLFNWADVGVKVVIKGKAPKKVARRGRGFTDYIALSKKRYKKSKKVHLTKRKKLIKYYSKFTHKKLNRLIRKNLKKRKQLFASKKYSKYTKIKLIKRLKKEESILRAAKSVKYKSRLLHNKKLVKKGYKKYRKKIRV